MEKEGYRDSLELLLKMYPNRVTLTVKEAAAALGVSQKTVYENVNRPRDPLPSKRVGNRIVFK